MATYLPSFKRTACLLLAFALTMLYPGLHAQTVVSSNGKSNYVVKTDNESLQIEHNGRITIGPDDRSITGIDDNGYLSIQKTISGNTRKILINERNGSLHYEYTEDGRRKSFEPEGKAWLADILPDLLRNTTIGAESRVDRLYSQGGVQSVISELPQLKSDHVKARYAEILFTKNIKPAEIPQIISGIGQHIDSDHYRYELFKSNSNLLLSDPQNTTNYLEAIKTVKSDHYKTGLIKLALENGIIQDSRQPALELIATINSDHYRSEILKELINQQLSEEETEFILEKLVQEIRSDHYRNEIIESMVASQRDMSSRGIDLVIKSMGNTGSDHYRAESLSRLMRHQSLSDQNYESLYSLLGNFGSDHYKAQLMEDLVNHESFGKHIDLFIREATNLRSDHFRKKLLEKAVSTDELNEDQVVKLINSTGSIGSDHFKSEFLEKACHAHGGEKVKTAIREAAKSIDSTHFYGKVMKCIE